MRWLIIFYLAVSFTFTYISTFVALPMDAGISLSDTASNVQSTLQDQSQAYRGSDKGSIGLLQMAHSYLSTIASMSLFSFEIGGAPAEINVFLRGLFGILSVLFWGDVVSFLKGLIPFVGR